MGPLELGRCRTQTALPEGIQAPAARRTLHFGAPALELLWQEKETHCKALFVVIVSMQPEHLMFKHCAANMFLKCVSFEQNCDLNLLKGIICDAYAL